MGLSKKSQLVGIDIGSHSIKIVQLLQKKKQFELLNAGLVPLPENTFEDGMTKNPNLVSEAVKQLISSEKIKTKFAVISISGESVVIKKINIPTIHCSTTFELGKFSLNNKYDFIYLNFICNV